ncbi:MAG: hypothetical protein WEB13_05245, partial [Dehalococcoidia bacterium]
REAALPARAATPEAAPARPATPAPAAPATVPGDVEVPAALGRAFTPDGRFANADIEAAYLAYRQRGGLASRAAWIPRTRGGPRALLEGELGADFPTTPRTRRTVERPRLPTGASAERVEPRVFAENFHTPEARAEQASILGRTATDPQQAGRDYQDLVARDLRAQGLQEAFARPGRRMDVGNRHEVTIEGRDGPFGSQKLDQLWLDMRDNRVVLLTVPRLSAAARSQLGRLQAQFQLETGERVIIIVRETDVGGAPASP